MGKGVSLERSCAGVPWNAPEWAGDGHKMDTSPGPEVQPLLDHLIRPQEYRRRDGQAECLRGLKVNDEARGDAFDGQIAGHCTAQHLRHQPCGLYALRFVVRPVCREPAKAAFWRARYRAARPECHRVDYGQPSLE